MMNGHCSDCGEKLTQGKCAWCERENAILFGKSPSPPPEVEPWDHGQDVYNAVHEEIMQLRVKLHGVLNGRSDVDNIVYHAQNRAADAAVRVLRSALAAQAQEIAAMVEVLKPVCDRSWADETPIQVATIAANAIQWRDVEISALRGRAEAAEARLAEISPVQPAPSSDPGTA